MNKRTCNSGLSGTTKAVAYLAQVIDVESRRHCHRLAIAKWNAMTGMAIQEDTIYMDTIITRLVIPWSQNAIYWTGVAKVK